MELKKRLYPKSFINIFFLIMMPMRQKVLLLNNQQLRLPEKETSFLYQETSFLYLKTSFLYREAVFLY